MRRLVKYNISLLNDEAHLSNYSKVQLKDTSQIVDADQIEVLYTNGTSELLKTLSLSNEVSTKIFQRSNEVAQLKVFITEDNFS